MKEEREINEGGEYTGTPGNHDPEPKETKFKPLKAFLITSAIIVVVSLILIAIF